ncbi:MAG: amino acid permease [Solirubrobacterales bacterium]|nr:amino acid permease [Solirubrobacterales bacterium]
MPLLYAGMAAVALMAVPVVAGPSGPETALGGEFIEAPVLGVVSAFDPEWLSNAMRWLVALIAAPTLIWAANTAMLGVSRHTYTLAVNRQIPSWLGQLGRRYEVPYKAILICGLAVFALALVGNVELLAGIYAFGATLAITIAHVSVIKLRRDEPDRVRPFRIPWNFNFRGTSVPLPALAGAILSGLALISVVLLHDAARWVGLGWLLIGLVGYVIYRKGIEQVSLTKQVTVEAHALTRPKISISLHNIVVPIFGTKLDDDIVSTAGRLAADEDTGAGEGGARLTVLYLIEVPMTLDLEGPIDPKLEDEAFRASDRAREVAEEYADVQVGVEIVRTRKIGSGIIDAAGRWDADAIVLGAEPPSSIKGGWMLGGTGESRPEEIGPATTYVLKNAPCRVLLTAPPTDAVLGDRALFQLAGTRRPAMFVLIVGCGRVGSSLALAMLRDGHTVSVLDEDREAHARLEVGLDGGWEEAGGKFAVGTALEVDALETAGIEKADAFVAATNGDNTNIVISQIAQRRYAVETVIARILDPLRAEWYSTQGMRTVCPTRVAVDMLETELRQAAGGDS